MEKKLKINFILKGIAVFAFVAFCLLAILAGVTLPFVSNASTADCAVASAENDSATASANILFISFCPMPSQIQRNHYFKTLFTRAPRSMAAPLAVSLPMEWLSLTSVILIFPSSMVLVVMISPFVP